MRFKGIDFYHTDRLLSEDEKMIRDTVREFVDNTIIPIINKHYEEGIVLPVNTTQYVICAISNRCIHTKELMIFIL